MTKGHRVRCTAVACLLFCFALGLNRAMGAAIITPTIIKPSITTPSVTSAPSTPARTETTITAPTLNTDISPNVNTNNLLNTIKPSPTIQYPRGGETVMMEQPVLLEFDIEQLPESYKILVNTGPNGSWKDALVNNSNKRVNSHDGYQTISVICQFPLDAKAMPNSTAKFKVVAYWDTSKTSSTESISNGFTILDKKYGPGSWASHSYWQLPVTAVPGNKSTELSWAPVAAVDGKVNYSLQRLGPGDNDWKYITDFPVTEASYTDNTVKNNYQYRYEIVANVLDMPRQFYDQAVVTPNAVLVFQVGSKIIKLNGADIQIDSPPVIKNGRTLVPIRALVENIGGTINYNAASEEIQINYNNMVLIMQIGNAMATIDGKSVEMDVPPYVTPEGRTMIPLRFVSENFKLNVLWDNATQSITIKF